MATFQKGQELASALTEKEMAHLWSVVLQTYRDANNKINDDLAKIYAKYLSTVDKQDYYNIMIQYDRLQKLQNQIAKEYADASKKAGKIIAKSSQLGFTNTFYREQFTLTYFAPSDIGMTFSILNPAIVQSSVFGTAELWKKIQSEAIIKRYGNPMQYMKQGKTLTSLLVNHRYQEIEDIQGIISAGLQLGDSYDVMTAKVHKVIGEELVKDGVKKLTGAKANAARIVQTEGTRNLNAGFSASLHDAQNQGLGIEKEWLTALNNSRDTHKTANRQRVPLGDNFIVGSAEGMFPGQMSTVGENANCHCSHIAIVDGVEPQLQRARNPVTGQNEVFSYKDFDKWAANNGLVPDKDGMLSLK